MSAPPRRPVAQSALFGLRFRPTIQSVATAPTKAGRLRKTRPDLPIPDFAGSPCDRPLPLPPGCACSPSQGSVQHPDGSSENFFPGGVATAFAEEDWPSEAQPGGNPGLVSSS